MIDLEDEVFLQFIEESQENLADIESDLLEMEEQADNLDADLVNKVFRAIHTVKGASGFFGLNKVKDLTHSMENLLGKVRTNDLPVTSELVSMLLGGADLLKRMIDQPEAMDEFDVSENVAALDVLNGSEGTSSSGQNPSATQVVKRPLNPSSIAKRSPSEMVKVNSPGGNELLFEVSLGDVSRAQRAEGGGLYIYLVEYDLYRDVEQKGKTPQSLIHDYEQITRFIDSKLDYSNMGDLDSDGEAALPFYILCSTVVDPFIMSSFADLPEEKIHTIFGEFVEVLEGDVSVNEIAPEVEEEAVVKIENIEEPEVVVETEIEKPVATRQKSNSEKVSNGTSSKSKAATSVRVSVAQLERLMNLAGELVLTRNALVQRVENSEDVEIVEASQRVDSITSELQEAIMVTRMQSVGTVFNKFNRIIRDLSKSLGKNINLIVKGEDVELDRTVIEAIGDPLTHIIRNSADHGIEMPDVRSLNGKSGSGTITIEAVQRAGQVLISIKDDGGGINAQVVGKKAIEKGLISSAECEAMTEKELVKLIFKPGFSTAAEVTDISGRGVGMDVVMTSLAKVGGVVDVDSVLGQGTDLTISLPLTLAIVPSLLLETGSQRFAIPQVNLVELVGVKAVDVKNRIEKMGESSVLRLRGELLPLVKLADVLEMPKFFKTNENELKPDSRERIADRRSLELGEIRDPQEDVRSDRRRSADSSMNIAVVSVGGMNYGIIVDKLLDSEEIVVKPLGRHLKGSMCYSGATILGDGRVAMILDVGTIKEKAKLQDVLNLTKKNEKEAEAYSQDSLSFLMVEEGDERFGIPMDLVSRIEKVKSAEFTEVGSRRAMLYRGDTIVLLNFADMLGGRALSNIEYNVVIFEIAGKEIGLVVDCVKDIVTYRGELDGHSYIKPGIMGTALIQEQIVQVMDLFGLTQELIPDLVTQEMIKESEGCNTVLIVEDSKFFQNQINKFVTNAGFSTFVAEDGLEALEILKKEEIGIVLTDIEMPNMDGLELTRTLRADPNYSSLPIIAITSLSGMDDQERGQAAGIDEYLIKLDQEQIIDACQRNTTQRQRV